MNGVSVFLVLLVCIEFATSESDICEESYSKKQFVITSKNYPNPYPLNQNCTYFIEGSQCARKYNFQFLDFDLQSDRGCLNDYLKIGDQEKLCGVKSGVKTYFAREGSLVLRFVTNQAVSGRGFKIIVTKLPCENLQVRKQNFYNFDWRRVFNWNYKTDVQTRFCCKQAYNSNHFFLSSPAFPYSHKEPSDCVYHIYKAKPNVCRLRIHVIYFLHGDYVDGCNSNFLEIDGKKLCGCQTDLNLITSFDFDVPKVIRFKNDGSHTSEYSGFTLEVFQDECPWKYSRLQDEPIKSAKLVFENVEQNHERQIWKHVYFFSEPEEVYIPQKDREETTYMDTSDIGFRLTENDATQCSTFDFAQLAQNELWVKTSQCGSELKTCKELNSVKGSIHSPGYPYYYPQNLNLCYRFRKQPGYCAVRLAMVDFQIEYSMDCSKDYLLLGNKFRYCGQQLHNTVSTLDLTKAEFEDVTFVTDSYYCNRGFRSIYEQLPCVNEQTTTPSPVTQTPLLPCNSLINDEEFTLNIYSLQQDTCVFTVSKSDVKVCRLELKSLISNLDCNSEDVFVKGRSLCTLTENNIFSVDYKDEDSIPIVYKRFLQNIGTNGLRVQLNGKQSSENCFYNIPEVPAEKLTSPSEYGLFLQLRNSTEDICGIIANATFAKSAENSCKVLMEMEVVKSCAPAKTHTADLPDNVEKLQLLLSPKNNKEDIAIQRVNCNFLMK